MTDTKSKDDTLVTPIFGGWGGEIIYNLVGGWGDIRTLDGGWGGLKQPNQKNDLLGGWGKLSGILEGGWPGPRSSNQIQKGGWPDVIASELASEYAFNMAKRASLDSDVRTSTTKTAKYNVMYHTNKAAYINLHN